MAAKRKASGESSSASGAKKKVVPPFWKNGLLASMEDPELQVLKDDQIVAIKDKYPKAKYHYLVMPNINLPNLKSLKKEHVELLEYMQEKGQELADKADDALQFRLGYHAVPSMSQLHLHVISQDFDSPCLKTKKHWNSFTTKYFVDSQDIVEQLKTQGRVSMDVSASEELLKRNLKCHMCKKEISNMPTLKTHIKQHNYKRE